MKYALKALKMGVNSIGFYIKVKMGRIGRGMARYPADTNNLLFLVSKSDCSWGCHERYFAPPIPQIVRHFLCARSYVKYNTLLVLLLPALVTTSGHSFLARKVRACCCLATLL